MNTVKVKSYAKVNLTLDVVGTAGGYHLIDSLVASINLYDLVCVKKRKDNLISVSMHGMDSEGIPPEQNNAFRAGEAFVRRFSTKGADITVYKNIPIGAGLGGSSADAAGVLSGLARLYGADDERALCEIADSLGSDTRYMLNGGYCRMQGRGEKLTPLPEPERPLNLFLICPRTPVSAGACYKAFDEGEKIAPSTENCLGAFLKGDAEGLGRGLSNALYPAAARLNEDVETALEEARIFSPLGACMTGSGSGVFALFETAELCDWARSRYRGKFRTYTVKTVVPKEKKKSFRSPFALTDEERELSSDEE